MDKFIADTSVWIDFFRNKLPKNSEFVQGLDNEEVVVTDVIVHEIVVGAPTEKSYHQLSNLLSSLTQLKIKDEELPDFNRFAWKLHRHGLKGKYTDLTIAYLAHLYSYPVASFDGYFKKLAKQGWIKMISF